MPTVLNLAHVPVPQVDGLSLVDLMRGRRLGLSLEAYSESLYPERFGWSPLHALRDGRFKLIDAPRPELYDLDRDPFEQENIYAEHRALAEAMTGRAAATGRGSLRMQDARTRVTPDLRARLAALGYISSIATRESARHAGLPDPKDCIGTHVHENDSFSANAGRQRKIRCAK
jgi:arylsulfatase A-like enzyme